MYKCPLCDLKTKQLNGLMSRHWKQHCNETYTKEQYKIDVLNNNGRQQKACPICNKPTVIPKGENEYPQYHKGCYIKNKLQGRDNPNYKSGKTTVSCTHCDQKITKHSSQLQGNNKFCSASCSMNFYALPENRTDKQKESDKKNADYLRYLQTTHKHKEALVKARAKMTEERKSKVEEKFYNKIKEHYPDAVSSYILGYYTWDMFIPCINTIFEVHGNYWHNSDKQRALDKRKTTYLHNNHPDVVLKIIWESEINDIDPTCYLSHISNKPNIFVLAGPSGCGKSYLAEQLMNKFNIIDYDKMSFNKLKIEAIKSSDKPHLMVTPMQAKRLMKELRKDGYRVWGIYLREDVEVIKQHILSRKGKITNTIKMRIKRYESLKDRYFQYYGSQREVNMWLLSI